MNAPDGSLRPEHSSRLETARFYAILDTSYVERSDWVPMCRSLIDGGADLIQVRAKRETRAERARLLESVIPLFPPEIGKPPYLIINDDVELCVPHPTVGLHLGQDDMPPETARQRIGPDRLIGLSTHTWEQAAAAQSRPAGQIDYFCVGPVFPTRTKPDYAAVGLELVRRVADARPQLPWFCIGGITRTNVAQVIASGASKVVAVSDVLNDPDPAGAVRVFTERLGAR